MGLLETIARLIFGSSFLLDSKVANCKCIHLERFYLFVSEEVLFV